MLVLSGADIAALVDATALMPVIADAMRQVSAGRAELPIRSVMPLAGGNRFGLMQGAIADPPAHGAKLLSLYPGNPALGRSSHAGLMTLFDTATGLPSACLEASILTALRTAAASAVATDALARADAACLAVIGSGEEAHGHIAALRAVRRFTRVVVWGRNKERAASCARASGAEVAETLAAALDGADVVCTTTSATEPFLEPRMLPAGVHLNAVGGSVPSMRELTPECVTGLDYCTDYRPAMEAGAWEIIEARRIGLITPEHTIPEIGEVLAGTVAGRISAAQRTVYRSMGVAAQDLAAALFIVARARETGVGIDASL